MFIRLDNLDSGRVRGVGRRAFGAQDANPPGQALKRGEDDGLRHIIGQTLPADRIAIAERAAREYERRGAEKRAEQEINVVGDARGFCSR
jgi:hypothetical protein